MALDPPLKKRRQELEAGSPRYDVSEDMEMSPEPEQQQQQQTRVEEPAAEAHQVASSASTSKMVRDEAELKMKKQHRSEIRSVYRAYRTLKTCLSRHPSMGAELDRELEKAFCTLLKLANGCTSVRRIAAELIPRYAVFCPTALDAASRVILQICEWTSSVLMQEEAYDAVIAETAEASFTGLVQLSVAANSAASSFMGLADMCAGVCRAVASYLLSHVNGNEILFEEKPPKLGSSGMDGFRSLVSRSMGKLFWYDPENVLASCFELLQADDPKRRRHGQHFLSQILVQDINQKLETEQNANAENNAEGSQHGFDIISKVIHPKPALERWIVSMVRTFRKLERAEVVEEALPKLLTLIKSLQTFSLSDLDVLTDEEPLEERRVRKLGRSEDSFMTSESRPRPVRVVRAVSPEMDGWYKEKEQRRRRVTVEKFDADTRRERSFGKGDDSVWSSGWRRESKHSEKTGAEGDGFGKTGGGNKKESSSSALSSSPSKSSPPAAKEGESGPMDVLMASEHLWIGQLGSAVTEPMLKSQFGGFGQLEDVSLFKDQGFALVQYKNIKDAVEAREEMQGSTIWGKAIRVKFLEADKGVPGSCHVWVGRISNQVAKEELLKDLTTAGLKPPVSVATLITSSALLLEFDGPDEANAVMIHIRQRRRGIPCSVELAVNRHLWVGRVDPLVCEDELLSAFSQYGELTGWKFIRQSGCCFIDFRSTDAAAAARARLNGARFGCQAVVVEFKNILHKNSTPSSPPRSGAHSSPPLASSSGGKAALSVTLENLCSKLSLESSTPGSNSGKSRVSKFSGPRDDRVPTNTLWIGLPDAVSPGYLNETELRSIFSVACDGMGTVTKVRSARTARGPCRFVEFDGVDAAATALQNIMGHLDSSIQVAFSNSAISLHQTDQHSDQPRRRDRSRGWDWEHEDHRSPSAELDDYRGRLRHDRKHEPGVGSPRGDGRAFSPSLPHGLGRSSLEKEFPAKLPGHPPPPLAPLPVSGFSQPDRIPCGSSWQDLSSPAGQGRSYCTPVTPAAARIAPPTYDQATFPASPPPPPPPLPAETPPPPPMEPPPPASPPPPLPSPPPEVTQTEQSSFWRGPLCKSGLQYCEVMVYRESSANGQYDGSLREPTGWPEKLDVTKRADLKSFKQTFNNCPLNQREVCRLSACPSLKDEHRNGFLHFIDYLKQRDRAGVVKIPGGQGLGARMLYILPWAAEAAAMLSVPAEPVDTLVCVVLPSLHP